MKNKVLKICMAFCISICFLLLSGPSAAAAGGAVITASAATAEAGKTAHVSFTLSGNPGIWALKFKVSYDHDVLKLLDTKAGDVFSEGEVTPPQTLTQEKFIFVADRSALANTTANGTLITLVFEVKSGAKVKDYPISIEVNQAINVDGNDVDIKGVNGKISVANCIHASAKWETVKTSSCTADGSERQVCEKCGEVLSTHALKATGHSFTKQVITDKAKRSDAISAAKATYFYTCTGCGVISDSKYFEYGSVLSAAGTPQIPNTSSPVNAPESTGPSTDESTSSTDGSTSSADGSTSSADGSTSSDSSKPEIKDALADEPEGKSNIGLFVGLAIGGVLLIGAGGGLLYYKKIYIRRASKK